MPTERDLGFIVEILIAEHQHRIFVEGVADRAEHRIVNRPGQIGAGNFGAEIVVQSVNRQGHRGSLFLHNPPGAECPRRDRSLPGPRNCDVV